MENTTPQQSYDSLPTAKQLYEQRDYQGCINACREVWKNHPQHREGIRFLYAWSIYRLILKAENPSSKEITRALIAIQQLCPELGEKDPLIVSVFRAAYCHLDAVSPRAGAALQALNMLCPSALVAKPESKGKKLFSSSRERYYMLRSKALASDGQLQEAIACVEEALNDQNLILTDKNPMHLRFRKAQCLHLLDEHAEALAIAVDVEPYLRQSYIAMLCGHCAMALGKHLTAIGYFASAMLQNRKHEFSIPAFAVISRRYEDLEIEIEVARDHARLENFIRDKNKWKLREYEILPEIDEDIRKPHELQKSLIKFWKDWEPMRYDPSTGVITKTILEGRLGFISDDLFGDSIVVSSSAFQTSSLPNAGTKLMYRRRRSYDRKKGKLGWEAIFVKRQPDD